MTKIERTVKEISDLRDFYRRIPKLPAAGTISRRRQGRKRSGKGLAAGTRLRSRR